MYVVQAYCACASDVNIRPSIEASHGWQGTAGYANVDAEAGMLVAGPLPPHDRTACLQARLCCCGRGSAAGYQLLLQSHGKTSAGSQRVNTLCLEKNGA